MSLEIDMNLQSVYDIAEICARKGLTRAIISPGSRNAPLTIAFNRHPKIVCYSVPDERSAAFIGLGMSLKSLIPTVLICTSGSAGYNYAPAVAEAYFNRIPLLILTADRPPELIDQRDGQTIYQAHLYGKHVKGFYTFPSLNMCKSALHEAHLMLDEAINLCLQEPKGPVHLNVPMKEPFYPKSDEEVSYTSDIKISVNQLLKSNQINNSLINILIKKKRIIILTGQGILDPKRSEILGELSRKFSIPLVTDIISNLHSVKAAIKHHDLFLKNRHDQSLQPDLIISFGLSVVSKNVKLFLRSCDEAMHWHLSQEPSAPDTFGRLTEHIQSSTSHFFEALVTLDLQDSEEQRTFGQHWYQINESAKAVVDRIDHWGEFTEIVIYKKILGRLPDEIDLHLANSLAVRYANFIGLYDRNKSEVFCNRGTSGIDGSNSTAVGTSLISDKPTILITGDMAFFYDRNAFWHNHALPKLKIIVFNNHGGGIFRMIDGPSNQPELEEFFETKQHLSARSLADEFNFSYWSVTNFVELEYALSHFLNLTDKKAILEIFTEPAENKKSFQKLFQKMSKIHF